MRWVYRFPTTQTLVRLPVTHCTTVICFLLQISRAKKLPCIHYRAFQNTLPHSNNASVPRSNKTDHPLSQNSHQSSFSTSRSPPGGGYYPLPLYTPSTALINLLLPLSTCPTRHLSITPHLDPDGTSWCAVKPDTHTFLTAPPS